jgi:hypothetical protein
MFDNYMFYRNSVRLVPRCKGRDSDNINHIANSDKILSFLPVNKIDDVDDVRIYNYIYLYKFFLGKRAFLTKHKSFFNLGK